MIGTLINGIAFGMILALLGVGITLVFGLGEVLNLSIGVFAVISVFASQSLINSGMNTGVTFVISLIVVGALGLIIDRTLISLVYRSEGEERILLGIFTTLGLGIFLEGILVNFYPGRYTLPVNIENVQINRAAISGNSILLIIAGTIILTLLFVFLRRTYLGKATRTVFQDERGAQLVGVNPRRIRTLVFVLSALIAGIAGILYSFSSIVSVSSAFELTIFAVIVSIVGGVRSIEGAIGAGIFLGIVNQFASYYIGSYIATIILFGAAIAVLLVQSEEIA